MRDAILGIDVGSKGVIAIYTKDNIKPFFIADMDMKQMANVFREIKRDYPDCICAIEHIHALYGSSAKATFSFGEIFGVLQAMLHCNDIPFHLIQPKTWQKEMWSTVKPIMDGKKVNTKATSELAAKQLFPNIDFRRSERCKKNDDNYIDAVLIAEYARRKNL